MKPAPPLVTRWDLDKTYLRTEFHTLGDLLRAALERPDQKRAVPGAARLLRELAHVGARIHILSGSPRQMRRAIAERLSLDGVFYDELTLKPNLQNLLHLRFRALKDQLSYKLPALLEARMRERHVLGVPPCPEILLGDDSEADAFVYSLYADLCSGRVDMEQLETVLHAGRVDSAITEQCLAAVRSLRAPRDGKDADGGRERDGRHEEARTTASGRARFRILIHLDQQTPPSRFASHTPRLVPFYNYAQAALILVDDGHLPAVAAYRVAQELCDQFRFDLDALARSYLDLKRRGHLNGRALEALRAARAEAPTEVARWPDRISEELRKAEAAEAEGAPAEAARPRGVPAPLDYVALAAHHRGGRNRRR
ncbi:MAG: hypothetical protein GX607_02925 [Myxococcales bacterium]|nr:hypothetical protein [Myxococcales bacterium]